MDSYGKGGFEVSVPSAILFLGAERSLPKPALNGLVRILLIELRRDLEYQCCRHPMRQASVTMKVLRQSF